MGTWTTVEIIKAIEHGYKVLFVKEIWHFNDSSDDLFKNYVNTFLKIKQESSGYPSWVENEADKKKYVHEYFEFEGIHLDPNKIQKNPLLRQISKLALNSLWGRFGMNTERSESEFVSDATRFFEVCNSSETIVEDLFIINDDMVELITKKRKEYVNESNVTNIFIAIFTAAYARLELFNVINK